MPRYTGDATYDAVLVAALALAGLVLVGAPFLPSPYGRFASDRFGSSLQPRLGWFLMELPASVCFLVAYFRGPNRFEVVPLVFLLVWCVHYGNRGFFFPLAMRSMRRATPSFSVMVLVGGWIVTALHGYLNGAFFGGHGAHYTRAWLSDPRFIVGMVLYAVSMAYNAHSDAILRNLRAKDESISEDAAYRIPRGGLFRWVSSPSYFTEICAWTGFALASWSLAAVFILAVSVGNLVPRALATHRWYRERFQDYPRERKALVPFVI